MNATGNRPPMMVPKKGLYMHKDLLRNAAYFGVPLKAIEVIKMIEYHHAQFLLLNYYLVKDPFNVMIEKGTLRAQRFLTVVAHEYPEHLEGVSRELWRRIWSLVRL